MSLESLVRESYLIVLLGYFLLSVIMSLDEYYHIFKGNIDDCFKVGIKFTKKSLKLYSPFYSSDLILASPLGLRMIIGSHG
jgi:hypothetical protein